MPHVAPAGHDLGRNRLNRLGGIVPKRAPQRVPATGLDQLTQPETNALAGQVPFGGNGDCSGFHANGRMKPNPVDDPCVERYGITPEYLRLMDIKVIAGRGFDETDSAAGPPSIVISQSTARTVFGTGSPLGAQVRIGNATRGAWRTVIGVVADVHHDDLTEAPAPASIAAGTDHRSIWWRWCSRRADAAALAGPRRGRYCLRCTRPAGTASRAVVLIDSRRPSGFY